MKSVVTLQDWYLTQIAGSLGAKLDWVSGLVYAPSLSNITHFADQLLSAQKCEAGTDAHHVNKASTLVMSLLVNSPRAEIIGFLQARYVFEVAEIDYIAVSAEYRRQGCASLLFDYFMESCHTSGIEKIFLEVAESNVPAVEFYFKNGFVTEYFRKAYYRNGENALVLKKVLNQSGQEPKALRQELKIGNAHEN